MAPAIVSAVVIAVATIGSGSGAKEAKGPSQPAFAQSSLMQFEQGEAAAASAGRMAVRLVRFDLRSHSSAAFAD